MRANKCVILLAGIPLLSRCGGAFAFLVPAPFLAATTRPARVPLLEAPNFPETNQASQDSPASSSESTATSLFTKIDEAGLSLKPMATRATAKATLADKTSQKYLYLIKSYVCYTLFILYRAYRGFFVILPAVFRETFRKLEYVVDNAPFEDDDSVAEEEEERSAPPLTTRLTVSILAVIVTASYALGGAFRVLLKLIRTGGSLTQSFEAAALEQEQNEATILRKVEGAKASDGINGREGLAP